MALGAVTSVPALAETSVSGGLDEVVVQARKVAENLQEVPLSISVFTAQDIARQNLSSNEDIARLDPSVIFDYGASLQDTRIVIRGLSPTRGRVNSAVLIDGIDITSESIQFAGGGLLATGKLFDLQQVEIVKGPQAALYGRSAFAGAIRRGAAPRRFRKRPLLRRSRPRFAGQ
jgi:outer membrane receptor protein involved in Fe transport